jgi:hypothetical protein
MNKKLIPILLLFASVTYAQSACIQSPTGYWTCGGAIIVTDNNALPTPQPNVQAVTGNNATIDVMPTPQANSCKMFDMNAGATDDCVITNGTTIMHIPPQASELPRVTITTKTTTPYTLGATADEFVLCDATSQNNILNLPAAGTAGSGRRYVIKKKDSTAHTCTVTPNGTEKIDGKATQVIDVQYTSISLFTDGSNWFIY